MRVTLAEYLSLKNKKKAKRKDNAKFIAKMAGKKLAPSRSKLRAQIWHFTSLLVRKRDSKLYNGMCVICKNKPIQVCYHIIASMEGDSTRYDLENLRGACSACNYAEFRWRRRYAEKHREIFGQEKMLALEAKAKLTVHFSQSDLVALRDERKRMLEQGEYK